MIRKSVVSGTFYPGKTSELKKQIENFITNAKIEKKYNDILGIISPHAGYVYSGGCAAYGYKCLQEENFDSVIIIAPSHRMGNFQFSVGAFEKYSTPLGDIEVDQEKVGKLLDEEGFQFIPQAHKVEHALEVQLPFLQTIKSNINIVPILVGRQNNEVSKYLAETLHKVFSKDFTNTKIVISSDLSHYHDSETAENMDGKLAEYVQNNQIEKFRTAIRNHKIEACGFGGILTLMYLADKLGYSNIEKLNYTHSGTLTGDHSQVVGYLSTLFYK